MLEQKQTKPFYDVVVTGSYFCDMIYTGLPEVPRLGADIFSTHFDMVPGGTYYIVKILHKLGLKAGWICDFGNDFFSEFILSNARKDGLDTSLSRFVAEPRRVVASSFSFKQDRGFVSYEDQPFKQPTQAELEMFTTRAMLIPGISDWKIVPTIQQLNNRKDMLIYMDCQHSSETIHTPGLRDALSHVDIFAPNECEALQFTGEDNIQCALDILAEVVPLVLLKRGSKGALIRQGRELIEVPAIKVEVKDTTGAGDSFNAGFVYAYLHQMELVDCLRFGNIIGGLSVTATGPLKCPDMDQIDRMIKNYQDFQTV